MNQHICCQHTHQASFSPTLALSLLHTHSMTKLFNHVFLRDSGASPLTLPHNHSRGVRVEEPDSDSEDFSPTPSLAEVSSDDLSWLDDKDPGKDE